MIFDFLRKREQPKEGPKEQPKEIVVKSERKPAHVYIATDRGFLLPWETLGKAKIQKSSKQIKAEKEWVTQHNLVPKKYDPYKFITLAESSATLSSVINQIAEDVVNDWRLVLKEGEKDDPKEKKEVEDFLSKPNPDSSLKEILNRCLIDVLTVGGLDIEIVRNVGGHVCEIYHVSDATMHVHKDGEKLAQQVNLKIGWFVFYQPDHSKVPVISCEDGEKGDFDLEHRANEILRYILYAPGENPKYGLSPLVPAVRNILCALEATDFSLTAFRERGLPEFLITLKGGTWAEGTEKLVSNFLRDLKGDHHKSMVIQLNEDQEIHFDPVATEIKGDTFTLQLLELNNEQIMSAYRIPPSRLATFTKKGGLASNLYSEANRVYWESCVRPKQLIIESLLDKIIQGVLGRKSIYHVEIEDLDVKNRTEESKVLQIYFSMGVYSVNDLRVKLGLETIKGLDDHYIAQQYIPITDLELKKRREEIEKGEAEIDTFMFELEALRREIKKAKQN